MADIIETVPFDFNDLYNGLKTKFADKGYDVEEGSNTSQLITAMAYLTSMLNVNTAVNINETILPLATKRNNVLQDARALGYEIQHKLPYTYTLSMYLPAGDHTIPKYAKFTIGDKTYYNMTKQSDIKDHLGGNIDIAVVEGVLHKFSEDPTSLRVSTTVVEDSTGVEIPQYYIDIPFVDVADDGIEVYVTYYDDYGNLVYQEEWLRTEQFMLDKDSTFNKQFMRLDNIDYNTPRIYFKLAGIGAGLRVGSIVEMNVLTTSGADGAIADLTDYEAVIHEIPLGEINGITLTTEGADEESIESIQTNAPLFHNSANRVVTKLDYEAFCNRQSSVETTLVWGGDDEFPKSPGHIWFSFLPSTRVARSFISDTFKTEYTLANADFNQWDYTAAPDPADYPLGEEDPDYIAAYEIWFDNFKEDFLNLQDYLNSIFIEDASLRSTEYTIDGQLINKGVWDVLDNYKIPTLEFHHRHPIILDFEYDFNIVRYNINDSKQVINESVFNSVDGFFTGTGDSINMEKFEQEYFHSSLEKRVDTILTDKTGYTNNITTKLMLTLKNVSAENQSLDYRDIYIPLAAPFEDIFSNNGYLLYDVLPNIDTEGFFDYGNGNVTDLWVDWSSIQSDIDNEIKQNNIDVISAPIRTSGSETVVIDEETSTVTFENIFIIPDDVTQISPLISDQDAVLEWTNTKVYLNDVEIVYGDGDGDWEYNRLYPRELIYNGTLSVNDVVRVETNSVFGTYFLFNSYKKYIVVQLYVNAVGFGDIISTAGNTSSNEFDTPKSYLTTKESFYTFTGDNFYLTTEGYTLSSDSAVTAETGSIVKTVSAETYIYSPLRLDLLDRKSVV